jgi:hypothetical protein
MFDCLFTLKDGGEGKHIFMILYKEVPLDKPIILISSGASANASSSVLVFSYPALPKHATLSGSVR